MAAGRACRRAAAAAAEVHHGQRVRQLVVHEGGGEQVELALKEVNERRSD